MDKLVDELRDALPPDENGAWPTRADFTRTLSSAVLGGFLLLGLAAAGCSDYSSNEGPNLTGGTGGAGGHVTMSGGSGGNGEGGRLCNCVGGTGAGGAPGTGGAGTGGAPGTGGAGAGGVLGTGGAGAGGAAGTGGTGPGGAGGAVVDSGAGARDGAALDSAEGEVSGIDALAAACTQAVDPELDRAIGESTLGAADKGKLCGCFSALDKGWTTSLTQLFATATPTEIAKMLSGLLPCCSTSAGIVGRNGATTVPSSAVLDSIEKGQGYTLCAAPTYKGVSFPD